MTSVIYQKLLKLGYLPPWFPDLELDPEEDRSLESLFEGIQFMQHLRLNSTDVSGFEYRAGKGNRSRNRYLDILPFDYNRVKLNDSNDYINASMICTPCGSKNYIAAQGPLPETMSDFWQMVWDNDVPLIVMLTNEKEGARVKCSKYWPNFQEYMSTSNGITIKCVNDVSTSAQIREREFEVRWNDDVRKIFMLHLQDWPDHGQIAPKLLLDAIDMANTRIEKCSLKGPPIIHCSAGVGRTGTYCTVDSVLYYLKNNLTFDLKSVDKYELDTISADMVTLIVNHFRKQRVYSVQNVDQFRLCFEAILLRLDEWHSENIPATWSNKP